MAVWAKVDVHFPTNPKVKRAGYWAGQAYLALLLINKAHAFRGAVPADYGAPQELAEFWRLDREKDLPRPAFDLMADGLRACERETLITLSAATITLVGWGPEWDRNDSSAARQQKYRDRAAAAKAEADIIEDSAAITNDVDTALRNERNALQRDSALRVTEGVHRGEERRGDLYPTPSPFPGRGIAGALRDALAGLAGVPVPTARPGLQHAVEEHLRREGWVLSWPEGGHGMIATLGDESIAVETAPSAPSKAACRRLARSGLPSAIVVRSAWDGDTPAGVDAVLPLRLAVKPAGGRSAACVLERWREQAGELWDLQELLRASAIRGSRPLKPTDERLQRVAERLHGSDGEDGHSVEDCTAVLRAYAAEAKTSAKGAQYFNGETNWRAANFDRTLGSIGTGGDEGSGGRAAPMARETYDETTQGEQDLK